MKREYDSDDKLPIPENASDRPDYIQGIGRKEATVIAGAVIGAIIMLIFVYMTGRNFVLWLFILIMLVAMVVIFIKRDHINESIIDKIMFMIRYYKSQKRYEYKRAEYLSIEETENDSE